MIEQPICRSDRSRWRCRRWHDSLFDQTEEVAHSPHFRLGPIARIGGVDASPDAAFQLGSLLLGDQVQDKSPAFRLSEQHIKIDECSSDTPQIVAGYASTKDRVKDR